MTTKGSGVSALFSALLRERVVNMPAPVVARAMSVV